jgi:hypothetical protein
MTYKRQTPLCLIMSRSILVYLILSSCLIAIALSCSCQGVTVENSFENARAVFSGKVTRITPSGDDFIVKFAVKDVWKGDRIDSVRTNKSDGMCGVGFKKGKEYVVFATQYEGKYSTGICDGTQIMDSDIVNKLNRLGRRHY